MTQSATPDGKHHWRFHAPHAQLNSAFGDDWFALKAEGFARFFGTPTFLIGQTLIVLLWMAVNLMGWTGFDVYPFILLNLAFSLQAAYAAPLILLAQTRQAERDKVHSEADALHREDLHRVSAERQQAIGKQNDMLVQMLTQNNALTSQVNELMQINISLTRSMSELSGRIEQMTGEMRSRICQ